MKARVALVAILVAVAACGTTPPTTTTATTTVATAEHAGSWSEVPDPASEFFEPDLFWTGQEVVILYGITNDRDFIEGSLYDPTTRQLRTIPDGNLEGRYDHVAAWTGDALLVYGGSYEGGIARNGLYDPATNTWAPVARSPRGNFTSEHSLWTGDAVLALPNSGGSPLLYAPDTDTWSTATSHAFLQARSGYAAVWTGEEVLLWGGCAVRLENCEARTGGVAYNPSTDTWRDMAASPLAERIEPEAVWTESEMIIWGGLRSGEAAGAYGAAYDPAADTWRTIAEAPIADRLSPSLVWTGAEVIVWGGDIPDGAVYNPTTDTWLTLPPNPIAPRQPQAAVWAGDRMLVFGGFQSGSGAEYILSR